MTNTTNPDVEADPMPAVEPVVKADVAVIDMTASQEPAANSETPIASVDQQEDKNPLEDVRFRKATVHDTATIKELLHLFHEEYLNSLGVNMSDLLFQKIASSNILNTTWVACLPDSVIPPRYEDDGVDEKGQPRKRLVAQEDIVFGRVVGVFSGFYTTYILDSTRLFHELVWYVHPDYRRVGTKLYKHCEDAIRKQGAKKIVMIHMATNTSDKLATLYKKMGYEPLETHYVKQL